MKRILIAALILLGSITSAGAQAYMYCYVPGATSPNNWVPCSDSTAINSWGYQQ